MTNYSQLETAIAYTFRKIHFFSEIRQGKVGQTKYYLSCFIYIYIC